MTKRNKCVDAGTEYCPCFLAETNDCVACSQLQGLDYCDCLWNGVCILQQYYMNGKKAKNTRKTYEGYVTQKIVITDKLDILKIQTDEQLVKDLREPGSYVFLKPNNLDSYFNTPMTIMDIEDDKFIYIAYQKVGCKTKNLDFSKNLSIKGPYWNAILGVKYLKLVENSKCLIVARGIGQSSIILTIRKLIRNNNEVFLILDKGKVNKIFINDFINKFDTSKINIIEEDMISDKGKQKMKSLLLNQKIQLVYSAGSNLLHRIVSSSLRELKLNPYFLVTNNNKLCCGEGICGACICKLKDGTEVKMCKCQINPKKMY